MSDVQNIIKTGNEKIRNYLMLETTRQVDRNLQIVLRSEDDSNSPAQGGSCLCYVPVDISWSGSNVAEDEDVIASFYKKLMYGYLLYLTKGLRPNVCVDAEPSESVEELIDSVIQSPYAKKIIT